MAPGRVGVIVPGMVWWYGMGGMVAGKVSAMVAVCVVRSGPLLNCIRVILAVPGSSGAR